jgi:hypothetical protein
VTAGVHDEPDATLGADGKPPEKPPKRATDMNLEEYESARKALTGMARGAHLFGAP